MVENLDEQANTARSYKICEMKKLQIFININKNLSIIFLIHLIMKIEIRSLLPIIGLYIHS